MPAIERARFLSRFGHYAEGKVRNVKERTLHSRMLTPPPLSPDGYSTLQLINNIPSQLTQEERTTAQAKIDRDMPKLMREGAFNPPKVNLVDVSVTTQLDADGKPQQVIQYSTAPSYYFQLRSGIDASTPYETARKLSHAGASIIVITGDNKIVLTSRPDNVQLYPRTFAATASGSWDGTLQPQQPGQPEMLVPPTQESALAHIKQELHDETGLPMDIINSPESKLVILGVAEDEIKKHRDILYMLRLPKHITSADMRMFHNEEKRNGNGHSDNDPMAGHLMFTKATAQNVEDLLTQVHAPWDALSRETFLMTGYMLKMQEYRDKRKSPEEAYNRAKRWRQLTQWRVGLNQVINIDRVARKSRNKKIRRSMRQYLKATAGVMLHQPGAEEKARVASYDVEKYRARPGRYDPLRKPYKQNLKEVKDEARRMGFNGQDELVERKRRRALTLSSLF